MEWDQVLGDLIGNVCSCIATNLQIRGSMIRGFIHQRYFPEKTLRSCCELVVHKLGNKI